MKFQYLAPALFAVLAAAQDKSLISIGNVQYSGNGCPQGSVSTSLADDRSYVTLGFDDFQTYIGPGASITDRTKNCEIHLTLNYPAGFAFAVTETTYHGYAQLDSGVTGNFFTSYYFSSNPSATSTTRTTISGGGTWGPGNVYTKDDTIDGNSVVRSPCGGSSNILNVNNRIALTSSNSNANGQISDDDATVAQTHQIHIAWYSC